VRLRPITPDDKPLIADAFRRLGDESRYRRFFTYVEELSPAALAHLTEIDHVDHEAIIAVGASEGEALGVARYIRLRDDPQAAEVAVAVVDDWQARGLGRALLGELTKRARQEGVRRFVATVQYENQRALKLLSAHGEIESRRLGPESELVVAIPEKRGIGAQLSGVLRAAAEGALIIRQSRAHEPSVEDSLGQLRPWQPVGTVVVGSDGSQTASVAVHAAADLAAAFSATLHVVMAYGSAAERPEALNALTLMEADIAKDGLETLCHARQGAAADVLVQIAEEQRGDVIVVGSRGMSGLGRLVGSVPNTISHRAPCSVFIVKTVL
jgi:nucleotide-binding universal stress UspA family protein/GNAT superfamily N-acetyltransferase